ncbi:flagellar hook-length control protein FliK [Deltaproteobacteria bacterium OttesenSCG-928-M10]|nr:flagellar hook-length control protein FliK [Deltaproteobacteria bacterium OttesenSCG-928-M10]
MDLFGALNTVNNSLETGNAGLASDPSGLGQAAAEGKAFGDYLAQALNQAESPGRSANSRRILASVLNNNNLSAKTNALAEGFMKGYRGGEAIQAGLDLARTTLPSSYKNQIGVGLMALGREGSSVNSMQVGASLMDCASAGDALKNVLKSLGAERSVLKLDKSALPALKQVLEDSGADGGQINDLLGGLMSNGMNIEQLFFKLEKLDLASGGRSGGLTATEAGLSAMGQFFNSLGASPDLISTLTSAFQPGEPVTAAALRDLLGTGADELLAPCLSEGDLDSLRTFLGSMGATKGDFQSLANLLTQSGGRLSMTEFLTFVENMETAPAQPVTGSQLAMVKSILENINREQELAKTPVFDETLTKLQMLGDREIDDDFMNHSPALQALRGGITAQSLNASMGGQNGQTGQNGQGRKDDREAKEHYRQVLHSQNSETNPSAAIDTVETVQSYGGQESLARQISQKMAYSHRRGLYRLKMNLNPENLGKLDIELKVKDSQLVAHIRAENREAFEAISGEIEDLKAALAEKGIEIANITVALDDTATGLTEFADLSALKAESADPAKVADDELSALMAAQADLNRAGRYGEVHRVI